VGKRNIFESSDPFSVGSLRDDDSVFSGIRLNAIRLLCGVITAFY